MREHPDPASRGGLHVSRRIDLSVVLGLVTIGIAGVAAWATLEAKVSEHDRRLVRLEERSELQAKGLSEVAVELSVASAQMRAVAGRIDRLLTRIERLEAAPSGPAAARPYPPAAP